IKRYILIIPLLLFMPTITLADSFLSKQFSGKIFLQTESLGEAWYVNPTDNQRYYLQNPEKAFEIMRSFGVGITNTDLSKITIGIIDGPDKDNDKLPDSLEIALGTNPNNPDSDNDGYGDGVELKNNYNPLGNGKITIDLQFTQNNAGKILIQTEKNSQAWYLNPTDNKRYFLNTPKDAFNIMRKLGLGITNSNLNKIATNIINPIKSLKIPSTPITMPPTAYRAPFNVQTQINNSDSNTLTNAATAILSKDKSQVTQYFSPKLKKAIEYTIDHLNNSGLLMIANIFSAVQLQSENNNTKTYSTEIYFNGKKYPYRITVQRQRNGECLIVNL
ncbi:MAG: thrombospondin type 3 repeat-containing protein, partial [Candidatus Falkowbacteria bacterium]|nr:thrombospondin type 3 repeat-containing protein [Candidatus Falkowbacteria bacterium]